MLFDLFILQNHYNTNNTFGISKLYIWREMKVKFTNENTVNVS